MVAHISSDIFSHFDGVPVPGLPLTVGSFDAEFSPAHRLAFADGLDALAASHWARDEVGTEGKGLARRFREKRDSPGQQGHPVVFLPKKSDTECVPVRRMSSWGFMSFVLAATNAVINVANNVNNNLNNRNNNKNEHNNNQVNTNIGNSGVMQMAMDAAMGGRRLDPDRLEELKKRLDASAPEPRTPHPRTPSELQMAMLMEKLYSAERDKTSRTSQEGLRQKVVELMEMMYKERLSAQKRDNSTSAIESDHHVDFPRQQDRRRRRTPSGRDPRLAKENLVHQAVLVAANHMSLWVSAHETSACLLADALCRVNREASKAGQSITFLSETLSLRSLELLMEDNIVDTKYKDDLLGALKKGQEGKECAFCPE